MGQTPNPSTMKKFLLPAIALILMGQGCFAPAPANEPVQERNAAVQEEEQAEEILTIDFASTPERAFEVLSSAAKRKDCETFLALMTERLELTEKDCFSAALELGANVPEIDEEATQTDGDSAKLMMVGGRTLTTMIRGEDGLWRADTVFWK